MMKMWKENHHNCCDLSQDVMCTAGWAKVLGDFLQDWCLHNQILLVHWKGTKLIFKMLYLAAFLATLKLPEGPDFSEVFYHITFSAY